MEMGVQLERKPAQCPEIKYGASMQNGCFPIELYRDYRDLKLAMVVPNGRDAKPRATHTHKHTLQPRTGKHTHRPELAKPRGRDKIIALRTVGGMTGRETEGLVVDIESTTWTPDAHENCVLSFSVADVSK